MENINTRICNRQKVRPSTVTGKCNGSVEIACRVVDDPTDRNIRCVRILVTEDDHRAIALYIQICCNRLEVPFTVELETAVSIKLGLFVKELYSAVK